MLLSDFNLPFDPALVATHPIEPRERARLLVSTRTGGAIAHKQVFDLPTLLKPGDLLVVNDSKVLPVRLSGTKRPGGGRLTFVVTRFEPDGFCCALLKGRCKRGQVIDLTGGATAEIVERNVDAAILKISCPWPLMELFERIGQMPLPPYVKREPGPEDRRWYQTVFADRQGSIAAPTAGLHFTTGLVEALGQKGVGIARITLHVGPGTFLPVRTARIEEHRMWPERYAVSEETVQAVARARSAGGRVIAVGTTVVRSLESAASADGDLKAMSGETSLFITPGYSFRIVDAMMTNFHLPRTTLAMLVAAFVGLDRLRVLYEEAIRERYRFYSYGDAMLIS